MSSTVPAQHPAVVLRSAYLHLRALLAVAAIAVVGLTLAVVVLAINTSGSTTVSPAAHAISSAIRTNPSVTVGPNPDQRGVSPAAGATSSAISTNPSTAVEPNPDHRGVGPAARATSSAIRATPAAAIGPNPDQRGPQPSIPAQLNGTAPSTTYTGHY
jgi:hypothetical protein